MKPKEWDSWTKEQKVEYARKLLFSVRGQYIISQALIEAIKTMKKRKYPEISNIEDMEVLLELFPIGLVLAQAEKIKLKRKI